MYEDDHYMYLITEDMMNAKELEEIIEERKSAQRDDPSLLESPLFLETEV
jgi:hypothetical protein